MSDIFISYSRKDKAILDHLIDDIRSQGYSVWTDEQIEPGTPSWRKTIEQAISDASVIIVLLSPAAKESIWVQNELAFAQTLAKPIIPIVVKGEYRDSIPFSLVNLQVIDYVHDNRRQALNNINRALEVTVGLERNRAPSPLSPNASRKTSSQVLRIFITFFLISLAFTFILFSIFRLNQPPLISNPTPIPSSTRDVVILVPSNTALMTPTSTNTPTVSTRISPSSTTDSIKTMVAIQVRQTITAIALISTTSPKPTFTRSPTLSVRQIIEATVVSIKATEQSELSPVEAGQLAALAIRVASDNRPDDNNLIIFTLGGVFSLLIIILVATLISPSRRMLNLFQKPTSYSKVEENKPEPLLEEYQVFMSSSDVDKKWVSNLVEELTALGFLIWWYAKDAPGLPFGENIKRAIYHTKVFVVVISPDSMKSKHVEEEIRWKDVYNRPSINIVYRPVVVEARPYGLAKGSDIDFADEREYKGSIELLTHAINSYLKQRLEQIQGAGESLTLEGNSLEN